MFHGAMDGFNSNDGKNHTLHMYGSFVVWSALTESAASKDWCFLDRQIGCVAIGGFACRDLSISFPAATAGS
jgi:hypothetical protein